MILSSETAGAAAAINHIEDLAKLYREARDIVAERLESYNDELRIVQRRRLPGIKLAVAAASDAQAKLSAAIAASPDLFVKPRTMTLHGIKLGYEKGKGAIEWEDDAKLIVLIRKTFAPATADRLIKKTEKPLASALAQLPAHELKKLGVKIVDDGDQIVIRAADGEVDKLVARLLEEGAQAEAAVKA